MKKITILMGLAAAGTASLHAQYSPEMTSAMETSKFWSVAGSLRGFYDDNPYTAPTKKGSFGYELSPSVSFNVPLQQTEFALKYTYGLYYYQGFRDNGGNNPYQQSHQVDLWVDHAFTERAQATLKDTFLYSQDPSLQNGPTSLPFRTEDSYYANFATATQTTDWTPLLSTVLSYNNNFYQYLQSGGNAFNPSLNGLLTRDEQTVGAQLDWNVLPDTTAWIGYDFGWINYWGGEAISVNPQTFTALYSDSRNSYTHTIYVGGQHQFLPNLTGAVKVGAQITDYHNSSDPNYATPYVDNSLTYTYAPGSYAQLDVSHTQIATSQSTAQNEQSTDISAAVNHQITAKLTGSVIGNIQLSTFNQGTYNNDYQDFYTLGLNLTYAFNQHLSTEVGYNFDALQTQVPNSDYNRNRVYVGLTAAY